MNRLSILLLFSSAATLAAQPAGHDHGGNVTGVTARRPSMIDGIGQSSFAITTSSPEAQRWFDRGVSLWHGFWDYEAIRAFNEAARLDTMSPMPYWGLVENLNAGAERTTALAKMKAKLKNASDREQYYVRASILNDSLPQAQRRAAVIREIEALIDKYPDDIEAKTYLARVLLNGYEPNGRPREGTLYVQTLLKGLLASNPTHTGVHHYWVHAMEPSSRPDQALESAELLARLAPGVGHLVHMPGHIFFRSGLYEKARSSFLDAARVDEEYMAREKVSPKDTWNYVHNVSFLVAALAEGGRYAEALEWMRKLQRISKDSMPAGGSGGRSTFFIHFRFANWDAALKDAGSFNPLDTNATAGQKGLRAAQIAYLKGMSAVGRDKLDEAQRHADALDAEIGRLVAAAQTPSPMLAVFSLDLRGNLHSRRNEHATAYELLTLAARKEKDLGYVEPPLYARPTLESLGEAYLRGKEWDKAKKAFEDALVARPNSGFALYGLARAHEGAGREADAVGAYRRLLAEWANADRDLPQLRHAKAYLARRGTTSTGAP